MFYSGNNALTYNSLFNFIIGNRGAGKTFWSKEWAIKDFLKTGKQFIYVRRYKTEFEKGKKEKFFDDIMDKFPEHEFKVKGFNAYIDDKECGQFMSLSTSKIDKGVPFPNVNKIIFDEFILDKGNYYYIPDEVINLLELYETVCRLKLDENGNLVPQQEVRVFFLSNAITMTNPYFLYFNIELKGKKKFTRYMDNEILVELVNDQEFTNLKKQTRFGKLIDGTSYGAYAIDNKFLRDSDIFIEKKTGKAKHSFILKYHGDSFGVWIDYSAGKFYVSKNIDESCKLIYSITLEDHTPNTMLLKGGQSNILKTFVKNYKLGNVYYESMNIKNIVYQIIRLSLL